MSSVREPVMHLAQCFMQNSSYISLDTVGLSKMILPFAFYQTQRTEIQNIA